MVSNKKKYKSSKKQKSKKKKRREPKVIFPEWNGRKVRVEIDCTNISEHIGCDRIIVPGVDVDNDDIKTFIARINLACPAFKSLSHRAYRLLYEGTHIRLHNKSCAFNSRLTSGNNSAQKYEEMTEILKDCEEDGFMLIDVQCEQLGGSYL